MTYRYVVLERRDKVGYLILNRPEKLNALHGAFVEDILAGLEELDNDDDLRVIIIKANGRMFSVGGDLSPEGVKEFAFAKTALEYKKVARPWMDARHTIRNLAKPTIVQVHGHFLAGATDLFLHCDFLVAANDAQIGCPDVKGMESPFCHMWTYLVGPQWAKFILLTGDNIDGATAERIGLVLKAVPAEQLDEEVTALARQVANVPVDFLETNKTLVNRVLDNMGYLASQELAWEASFLTHVAPAAQQFHQIIVDQGLQAALAWRKDNYG